MSNFEMVLICLVCATPLVALLFVLPKKMKKDKKQNKVELKTLAEIKQEEQPKEQPEEVKVEPKEVAKTEISSDDFESYAEFKRKNLTKPTKMELPKDFIDRTSPFVRRKKRENLKPKNVAEEINSLSPTLKAMLIAGVLDRKNFDN